MANKGQTGAAGMFTKAMQGVIMVHHLMSGTDNTTSTEYTQGSWHLSCKQPQHQPPLQLASTV
jgi:hypothetical protein